jgi:hypothetical protein
MNNFFDALELLTGAAVVIAAHPRFNKKEHKGVFDRRTVIHGKTMELVKSAKFVVTHSSTSISGAVLFRKPLLMVAHPSYRGRYEEALMRGMAKELNKEIHWVGSMLSKEKLTELLNIDDRAYASYINNHIKSSESANQPLWDNLVDYINQIHALS